MVIYHDHVSHMKVKVAELKARLSGYVRQVRRTGEPVEVFVREESVAYLVPAGPAASDPAARREEQARRDRLRAAGLRETAATGPGPRPDIIARPAGDGRTDVSTMAALRGRKDW